MNHSFEEKFPGFNKELDLNDKFMTKAIQELGRYIADRLGMTINIDDYINGPVKYDLNRAITYDILRYASFHDIKRNEDTPYNVEESVRASYFLKWILQLRPLSLDRVYAEMAGSGAPPPPLYKEDGKQVELMGLATLDIKRSYYLYYCNEHLAISAATVILNIMNVHGKSKSIGDFYLEKNGFNKLVYALRYRLKHQDTYQPFLSRIKALSSMIPQMEN